MPASIPFVFLVVRTMGTNRQVLNFMYLALRTRKHVSYMHPTYLVYPKVMIICWVNPVT